MKPAAAMRAFATVSGLTGLSRILGLARDLLLGAIIGPGLVLDAWRAAFWIPNMIRRMFAENAMSAAFVPLFKEKLVQDPAQAMVFARATFTTLVLILTPLVLLMVAFMPTLMDWLTGFERGTRSFELAVIFGRIMIPYLLFMSLMAFVGSTLDAFDRFAPKAFAPSMLNIILVGVLCAIAQFDLAAGSWLAWGTFVAGAAQLAVVWWPAQRLGLAPRLTSPKAAGPFLQKLAPGLIARGGFQLSSIVVLILASQQSNDLSHLYFADRVYQLPLGIIGIALNTVLLSSLSGLIAQGDVRGARVQLNRAFELAMLLALPIAFACVFVPNFLFIGLFQVGNFTAADSAAAGLALAGYALGIPAAVGQTVIQPAFFARQNTRAPMFHSLGSVLVIVVASVLLYPNFGIFGLAIAASLGSWTGFISLAAHLALLGYVRPDTRLGWRLLAMLLASILMSLGLLIFLHFFAGMFTFAFWLRLPLTLVFILLGALIYFAGALLTGATSRADLRNFLGRG